MTTVSKFKLQIYKVSIPQLYSIPQFLNIVVTPFRKIFFQACKKTWNCIKCISARVAKKFLILPYYHPDVCVIRLFKW